MQGVGFTVDSYKQSLCPGPLLLALAVLAGGCGSVERYHGVDLDDRSVVIVGLPAVAQSDSLPCGAACIASIALYWNNVLPPGRVAEVLDSRGQAEHSAAELCALGERLHLASYAFQGTMEDIETQLRKGRPVIVMIRPHFVEPPFWAPYSHLAMWITLKILRPKHWVMVAGLLPENGLLIQDPGTGAYRIERSAFEKEWEKHENVCVLTVPRNQVSLQEGKP